MSSLSDIMTFRDLVNVFEGCSRARDAKQKSGLFQRLVGAWRKRLLNDRPNPTENDEFFCVMRLCLPDQDLVRPAFNMKEKTVAKLFVEALRIPQKHKHYQAIMSFENDGTNVSPNSHAFDLKDIIYEYVRDNLPTADPMAYKEITITRINKFLDLLATSNMNDAMKENRRAEFAAIIKNSNATDVKWLIALILKSNFYFGLSRSKMLELFHADAKKLYDYQADLRYVCQIFINPDAGLCATVAKCRPMCWCKPMLCMRTNISSAPNNITGRSFFIETKYDGERFQLHKKGDNFLYFSKRGFAKYSTKFGRNFGEGTLTPMLEKAFSEGVRDIIIDGEMMQFDKTTGKYVGMAQTSSNVKHDTRNWNQESSNLEDCFVVFDILLLNDETLVNFPLQQRKQMLQSAIREVPFKLKIAESILSQNSADVIEAFRQHINDGEEGLVVKFADSPYRADVRDGRFWMKIKPDYSDQLCDSFDMLVMGASYGDHSNRDVLSKFVMGVRDESAEDDVIYRSVVMLGGQMPNETLKNLNVKLLQFAKLSKQIPPPYNLDFGKMDPPTYWFPPEYAPVFSVMPFEMCNSNSYPLKRTLRFARFREIRSDVDFNNCMTAAELLAFDLGVNRKTGLSVDEIASVSDAREAKKRPRLAVNYKPALAGAMTAESFAEMTALRLAAGENPLKGKEIAVVDAGDKVNSIRNELNKFGAVVTTAPKLGKTHLIIAFGRPDSINVTAQAQKYDILNKHWFESCMKAKAIINPNKLAYFASATPTTRSLIADKYGTSYTARLSIEELKQSVDAIKKAEQISANDDLEVHTNFMDGICSTLHEYSLFRHTKAYFGSPKGEFYTDVQFSYVLYGGIVANNVGDLGVTHIFIDNRFHDGKDWAVIAESIKAHFLTTAWIKDSIEGNQKLEDRFYRPK